MRLIIAEDALLVREGLTRLLAGLGHQVVATATRAEQVLSLVARHLPDVVIMDIRMPPTQTDEGIRLALAVRERHPAVAVLVLSQYSEPAYAATLLDAGTGKVGYLLKDRLLDRHVLNEAIRRLSAGGVVIEPLLVGDLLRRPRAEDPVGSLTDRERDVLALMAEGLSDRGIAERLSVSTTTVGTHIQSLFRKLELPRQPTDNRRVAAVLAYLRRG
jgi:DNA-binding NarL/FixJ family response regulator